MQAPITEHGILLKEKGGEKVATTLIKDMTKEVTSAIQSIKAMWNADMKENLVAMRATNQQTGR